MELTRRAFCNLAAGAALSLGAAAAAADADSAHAATFSLVNPEITLSTYLDSAKHIWFNEGRAILDFSWDGHEAVGMADKQGNLLACYVCEQAEETDEAPYTSYPFQSGSFALTYKGTVRIIDASGEIASEASLPDEVTVVSRESDSVCYGYVMPDGWFNRVAFSILVPSTEATYDLSVPDLYSYDGSTNYYGGLGGWKGWRTSCERGMGVYAIPTSTSSSQHYYYLTQNEGAQLDLGDEAVTNNSYFFDEAYYPVRVRVKDSTLTTVLATCKGETKELTYTSFPTGYLGNSYYPDSAVSLYTRENLAFGSCLGEHFFVWNLETEELTWAPDDYDTRIDWDAIQSAQPPLYDGGRLALPLKGDDGNTYVAMFDETFSPVREPVRGDCDEAVDGYPTVFSVTQGSAYSGFSSGRLIVRHGTSCHDEGALRGQDVTVYDADGQVVFEVSGQDCYMFGDYHDGLALYVSTADPDTLSFVDTDGAIAFTGFDTSNAVVTYI